MLLSALSILRDNTACNRFVCVLPCGAVFRNSTYVHMVKKQLPNETGGEREPTRMPAPRDTGVGTNLRYIEE